MDKEFDYIFVGGGIEGCVVASRLRERLPAASILLLEAGPDASNHPLVQDAVNAQKVRALELNWKYPSIPQTHLGGKVFENAAGRALGGGSAINAGGWVRGDANDYNAWAKLVDDDRWSYAGFLRYFRKIEHHHSSNVDPLEHSFQGPIHTQTATLTATLTGRDYPLRAKIKEGLAETTEAWKDGKRQLASIAYSLEGVKVLTKTLVHRVMVKDRTGKKTATGVELDNGVKIKVKREIVICAGAYRTPQLLLLSDIGPSEVLAQHGLQQVVDSPNVGRNLHDHLMIPQYWKLKNPDAGLAMGSSKFNNPNYTKGLPLDWIGTQPVPSEGLKQAIKIDEGHVNDDHPQIQPPRSHLELYVVYVAASHNPPVPMDGTHIMTTVVGLLPTSRGTVSLASTNPHDKPVIDNNYYATEHDRHVLRTGLKLIANLMTKTPEGQSIVEKETVADGFSPLSTNLSNEDLDARVRFGGGTLYHPAGTAAMGKVVDSQLRVYGVEGLRIADASVLPLPLACHYQACIFALGSRQWIS